MDSFILIILLIALLEAVFKQIDIFDAFIQGVKEGLEMIMTIFPTLLAFSLFTNMLQCCGLFMILEKLFIHLINALNVPIPIFFMMILRPFSSQGSLVILNKIFQQFGVDHRYGLLGSIVQTGSDTTFYVVSLYFSSLGYKDFRYALKLGLSLDLLASVIACLIYYFGFI